MVKANPGRQSLPTVTRIERKADGLHITVRDGTKNHEVTVHKLVTIHWSNNETRFEVGPWICKDGRTQKEIDSFEESEWKLLNKQTSGYKVEKEVISEPIAKQAEVEPSGAKAREVKQPKGKAKTQAQKKGTKRVPPSKVKDMGKANVVPRPKGKKDPRRGLRAGKNVRNR